MTTNTTPAAPYKCVGDAHQEAAFLTGHDGYDKAVLRRVTARDVDDAEYKKSVVTDAEWQRIIDLIDAAPKTLAALENMVDAFCTALEINENGVDPDGHEYECVRVARAEIANAKGQPCP